MPDPAADLAPTLREAAAVAERIARRTDDPTELAALRLLAGLVPGEGVEVRYGAENVRAYVDGIVAGLTGRQHYVAPLAQLTSEAWKLPEKPFSAARLRRELDARRATTPGDDRGRELAEWARDELREFVEHGADRMAAPSSLATAVDHALRALAAPADTEAGDDVAREVIVALRGLHSLLFVIAENLRRHATDARVSIAQAGNLDGCRRDVTRMIERLAATPPPLEGEAGKPARRRSPWDRRELRIVVEANVDLFDVEAAETTPRSYGIAEHIDRTVVAAVAAVPGLTDVRSVNTALRDRRDASVPGEGQGATEGGDGAVVTARLALDGYYSHGIRNDAVDVGYDAAALVAAIRAQPAPGQATPEGIPGQQLDGTPLDIRFSASLRAQSATPDLAEGLIFADDMGWSVHVFGEGWFSLRELPPDTVRLVPALTQTAGGGA